MWRHHKCGERAMKNVYDTSLWTKRYVVQRLCDGSVTSLVRIRMLIIFRKLGLCRVRRKLRRRCLRCHFLRPWMVQTLREWTRLGLLSLRLGPRRRQFAGAFQCQALIDVDENEFCCYRTRHDCRCRRQCSKRARAAREPRRNVVDARQARWRASCTVPNRSRLQACASSSAVLHLKD